MLLGELWEFADHSDQEHRLCRDQELHLLAPVRRIWVQDGVAEHLVVGLERL